MSGKASSGEGSPARKKSSKLTVAVDPLDKIGAKELKDLKERMRKLPKDSDVLPLIPKKTRKKSENVKTPGINLAKQSAKDDP